MTGPDRVRSWADMPPQPWAEGAEPPVEVLADWLLSLSREQFMWLLDRKRLDWGRDSRCWQEDHDGRLTQAEHALHGAATIWQRGYDAGLRDGFHRMAPVGTEP